ncbi:polyserase-related [Holotrichia oblita]|nr:polyserase-related [Holotrichia oblita]
MKLLLVIVNLLVPIWATSLSKTNPDGRIFNGAFAYEGQFKYQISLRAVIDNTHICGGSIIRPNWILTAGHCVYDSLDPRLYFVVAGTNYLDYMGHKYGVHNIIIHPAFIFTPKPNFKCQNDVALLKLWTNINVKDNKMGLINLDGRQIGNKQKSVISGWGATTLNLISAFRLKYASVETIDCKEYILSNKTTNCNICIHPNPTGGNPGSAWRGDSGGPLVIEDTKTQIGIASFTSLDINHVDVYARISCYKGWIDKTIAHK